MLHRRSWVLLAVLALFALGVQPLAHASQRAKPCIFGNGNGFWELPDPSGANGFINGVLSQFSGAQLTYHITGQLTEIPSACLSCREGFVDGILDDGIGSTPDFVVHGHWIGGFLSGQGTWEATIYKLVGPAQIAVGEIQGTYNDPPNVLQGTFKARWDICM